MYFELEPAIAAMREDPRFQELLRKAQEHLAGERRELDRMRAEGLVPDRSKGGFARQLTLLMITPSRRTGRPAAIHS